MEGALHHHYHFRKAKQQEINFPHKSLLSSDFYNLTHNEIFVHRYWLIKLIFVNCMYQLTKHIMIHNPYCKKLENNKLVTFQFVKYENWQFNRSTNKS